VSINALFYGDNLDVLRRYVKDETVDLVYLDPPFNSNANYSVLFGHADGSRSAAQIQAFEDTWRWDQAAAEAFQQTVIKGGQVAAARTSTAARAGRRARLAASPQRVSARSHSNDVGGPRRCGAGLVHPPLARRRTPAESQPGAFVDPCDEGLDRSQTNARPNRI